MIGVVATSYPRWPGDAAGGFVAGHVDWLRASGADVEILAAGQGLPAPTGLFYGGGAPEALERGLGVLGPALGFSAQMLAKVAVRARRWDAIAAHWLAPGAVAAALAPTRVPVLAIAHGGDVHLLARAKLLAPVLALLVARDARIVFVSDELRRRALDAVPRVLAARVAMRSIVQAMGVDDKRTARIVAARRARARDVDARPATIVVLARLVPVKGVDVAIEAMRHVRAEARLVIAGDGPMRAALEAAARDARVDFAGWLDADARDALLARADALLVPSAPVEHGRSEGMPMAAREALAAGVPVIASATGGLVELAAHGATLVPPRDPRALAVAIDRVLAAPPIDGLAADVNPDPRATAALGWRGVGAVLDGHWRRARRAHPYAPGARASHVMRAQWSSRPAAAEDAVCHSRALNISGTC